MSLRRSCRLRRGFDQVGLVQFERDGLVVQRFAEFDFYRIHKRTTLPTVFVRGELEQFRGLPVSDEEQAGADWNAIRVALENEIARKRKFGEQGWRCRFRFNRDCIRRCAHIPGGMQCAKNLRHGRGRRGAAVVELDASAQGELPTTRARVALPRHGESGLRAALCI